jgi:hypothetical protein
VRWLKARKNPQKAWNECPNPWWILWVIRRAKYQTPRTKERYDRAYGEARRMHDCGSTQQEITAWLRLQYPYPPEDVRQ